MSPSLPSTQAIASECTFTLSGVRPHRVLRASGQVITCALTHPRYGEIARVIVWHFDRTFIRGRYLTTDLDGEAREDRDMYVLYTFVFDKFGKRWENRDRPEVESLMLKSILDSGLPMLSGDFILRSWLAGKPYFARGHTEEYLLPAQKEWNQVARAALLRNVGFRLIGRTDVFAYTKNSSHPSRSLSVLDDSVLDAPFTNIPNLKNGSLTLGLPYSGDPLSPEDRWKLFPIHSYIMADNLPEDDLDYVISKRYLADPSIIHQRDDLGSTPRYIAVMKLRVSAVSTLLALGARDDIDRRDNIFRLTAREICERNMIEERYVRDGLDGTFDGFDEKHLRMMWMMKKYGDDVDEGTDPRTRLDRCEDDTRESGKAAALLSHPCPSKARESSRDVELHLAKSNTESKHLHQSFQRRDQTLIFLPPHLRQKLSPQLYTGWRALLSSLVVFFDPSGPFTQLDLKVKPTLKSLQPSCLWENPCVDTIILSVDHGLVSTTNVRSIRYFLENGGLVEYALDYIMCMALDESPLSPRGKETLEDESWQDMPSCVNDLDFEMVRAKCCPEHRGLWGPWREGF
ncbi:uncharacterized protein STEHIDRAFT_161905 [Stereum hirsutum FP-91666 SS1]|uniref:uncharacterized protein n=1 Tax=Stereum hirsutum (strain FP-91666) TaxID=721885 RepID=UPI000444A8E0|nr:uncharacterized protein STEHIDRAFT_161905 [Stereum hirsutum FP-91666 SS1]EIM81739.1 hypothetical protein STEHIDRAFT_161905 [Stereum hirsutum FP-91666 SS1]